MKNNIRIIPVLLFVLAAAFASCDSWLDVEPKSQVKDRELFSSESGFKEALAGVYSSLVDDALYTKEMRFGMLDVLAHQWTTFSTSSSPSNPGYPDATAYDYSSDASKDRIAAIWEKMYNAISNANVILEVIDNKKSLFSGNNYNIIKGEALALRAFIHFDLLRCFGVSYAVDRNMPSIPYVKLYTSQQSKQLTVDEVARLVIEDLKEALGYLENDPIHTGKTVTEFDDNGYLINRQLHLNYWAVKGLMARVYLYMGEYGLAAQYAQEVVESGVFTWVTQSSMTSTGDPSGASEQLWGIDVNNLDKIAEDYFLKGELFSLNINDLNLYYDGVATDYRYLYLFKQSTTSSVWLTKKFDGPGSTGTAYYRNKMSMIKLSEIYFILAESRYYTSGDWLGPLNEILTARGISPFDKVSDFKGTLANEYRKEFFAEGQMFFLYKRFNLTNIYGVGSDVNLPEVKGYTFPLPESELRAADREDNR